MENEKIFEIKSYNLFHDSNEVNTQSIVWKSFCLPRPSINAALTSTKTAGPINMYMKKWRKIALPCKNRAHTSSTKPARSMWFCTSTINFMYHRFLLQHLPLKLFREKTVFICFDCWKCLVQWYEKSISPTCAKLNIKPCSNK